MWMLQSGLENQVNELTEFKHTLQKYGFGIGGNWDYHHGFFDCALDEKQTVWLRIPFAAEGGSSIDGEAEDMETIVSLGRPFVLKHLYNEGLDGEAAARTVGGLVDQFQEPVNPDAAVEPKWVDKAEKLLRELEYVILHQ